MHFFAAIKMIDDVALYKYGNIFIRYSIMKSAYFTMEYYSAIKKNEIMPFAATWMDLEIIILSEVSQTEKDKYHMIPLICGT